jgi:hypothetical protein
MRTTLLTLAASLLLIPAARAADDGWTHLFNGADLKGLKFQFMDKDKDSDPAKTFSVKDGALIVTGKPTCYFYTDKSYSNYVVTFDWRFPENGTPDYNSGCLMHIQPPHKVFPKCVEAQGRYKDHGKLYAVGGLKGLTATFDAEAHKKALKAMGEWNTTEVTCKADGSISVKLNGTPIASGKSELTEGPIGWQSEGFEVHFKNIKIKQLK